VKNYKINTAQGLEALLRIIAEESVSAAVDGNAEVYRQKSFAGDIQRAKKGFYLEEDPPAGAPPAEPAAAEPPAETPPPAEEPAPEPAAEDAEEIGSVEPADVKRALNRLRAGKSVEDSAVEDRLEDFVTSLSTPERKAVFLAINSIAKILTSDEVPSSPFKSSKISVTSEEKPESPAGDASAPASPEGPVTAPAPAEAGAGAAPPIKVGESPVTEAYRQKIRKLIRGF
jgi:hypothetical protein